jgi:4-amino-4-deoxy-L-arabinose transferase-like glycosyltransferase
MPMVDSRPDRSELLGRWGLPLVVLTFFVATASGYGVFRDELYYIACARHLDWGYVDHPPLVALIAWLARAVVGDSWIALRILSAVAAASTVLLVGDTARDLGGGPWARRLAQNLAPPAPS